MFEQLFGSKTRVKLLKLFYTNPNRSFYVREITRKVDEQINSVRRELSNLLGIGIIKSDANNNRLYYEVNQEYEFYSPLATIFGLTPVAEEMGKSKEAKTKKASPTVRIGHPLTKDIQGLGRVELAVLTGQFTRDESSGVDVVIVGDVNQARVTKFIAELERNEGKELRYVIMPTEDYKYRLQINDRFIINLIGAKKQVIVNAQSLEI